ncbi:LysR family transcriptional regulator [Tistrella bauzanensis]|jgi:DNA-binding transcriptional LysR family regulator|uniref:LysR family transcriptional regulator n=1 Tax=Tistrella arctica TaxID=3133430 RepID=A0ABU9YGC3_9PROT
MRGGDYVELTAFLSVAEERSFRRAAARLAMSPSALSHTIRSLEERLGARLLNRTTRSVSLTEAGQSLFARLRPAMDEIGAAVQDVSDHQSRPRGVVRVNLPRIAARLLIAPMLADFTRRYPDVRLDLVIDDDITDIVAHGFDAGIRSGGLVQQDMIAVRLTPDLRMAVVGAPAYAVARPPIRTPHDLVHHACLTYRWSETGILQRWQFEGADGPVTIKVDTIVSANETDLLLAAAVQGAGIAYLEESLVAPHLRRGGLIRMLDDWCKPFPGLHLYYLNKPHMPAALRAFIDVMKSQAHRGPDDHTSA